MRILACLLALLASMSAQAQPSAARCLSDFLSRDGDWLARTFDGRAVDGDAFTPVKSLFVRNGHVHAAVWQSEPTSARIKSAGSVLLLKFFYPAVLPGIKDASAKRLQPYANSEHRLVIPSGCTAPDAFTIEIRVEGRTHSIGFVRVPTSPGEFQEPANWDW
jgi:hypothetical protein